MDFSLIGAAATSLGIAKDLAKAAIGVRDFNAQAATIAQMNEQILKAQDALFIHSANMNELQQKHFETLEKLRAMEKLIAERGRYSLFEISKGVFVYRSVAGEYVGHDGNPIPAQPDHYVCQRCFDKGIKSVLSRSANSYLITHRCTECGTHYLEQERAMHLR